MWNEEQEGLIDAIHEGTNCSLVFNERLIPSIFDSVIDERPVLEAGGGKQLIQSITVVVPLADENFEEYPELVFKVGQIVTILIRNLTHDFRVNIKALDEASYTLTCVSIEV